ncbi:MAG: hypothetical protein GX148_07000 [Clostridiales bacterium]|jgi:histidinol phosphatase-like PHP family hydrolase|nr:hypothetical protein [Clostridiales bacterium]
MKDYHVHYYLDACAAKDMTFPNIEKRCLELGIDEISVLKHYSHSLPNGKEDWVCWHRIKENGWRKYLEEYASYIPERIKIHSGVETELVNEKGDINIPLSEQNKIDMCALSVHYMIDLDCLKMDFLLYPNLDFCPEFKNEVGYRQREEWREKVNSAGAEKMITGLANGYINAIQRFSKVKTLSHMYDGLTPLRTYLCDVDSLGESKCIELLEPLMKTAAEYGVLWELYGDRVVFERVLVRANELGVKFCATADGHMLYEGWGPLTHHNRAEDLIDRLKLNRGEVGFSR